MYGPISKDGPALEFGEVGEEIKEEVRRQVAEEVAERVKGKLDACDLEGIVGGEDPFWSEENLGHLQRAAKSLDAGGGEEHGLVEED